MEIENRVQGTNPKTFKLKGRKTGKVKYLVIIDDDDVPDRCETVLQKKTKSVMQFIQAQVDRNKKMLEVLEQNKKSSFQTQSLANHSVKAQSLATSTSSRRVTRSSATFRTSDVYSKQNHAKIPTLMKQASKQYSQMMVKKIADLRRREVIYLCDE